MCLLQVNRALLAVRRSIANSLNKMHKWQERVKERKAAAAAEKLQVRDADWMEAKKSADDATIVSPAVEQRIINLAAAAE